MHDTCNEVFMRRQATSPTWRLLVIVNYAAKLYATVLRDIDPPGVGLPRGQIFKTYQGVAVTKRFILMSLASQLSLRYANIAQK